MRKIYSGGGHIGNMKPGQCKGYAYISRDLHVTLLILSSGLTQEGECYIENKVEAEWQSLGVD